MKKKFVKQTIFGMLILLLAAVFVFPAIAAAPTPVQVILIEGDPEGDTITTQANQSWLTYDDGTCSGKCRFNTHIPTNASSTFDQVPYPPVSTLWVQVSGDGSHFEAIVISQDFAGKSLIQKQRLVMAAVREQIASGELHALSIKTYTPEEWEAQHG